MGDCNAMTERVFSVGVLCQRTEKDYREYVWPGKAQPTRKVAREETEEGGGSFSPESRWSHLLANTIRHRRWNHVLFIATCKAKDTREGKLDNCLTTSTDSL